MMIVFYEKINLKHFDTYPDMGYISQCYFFGGGGGEEGLSLMVHSPLHIN